MLKINCATLRTMQNWIALGVEKYFRYVGLLVCLLTQMTIHDNLLISHRHNRHTDKRKPIYIYIHMYNTQISTNLITCISISCPCIPSIMQLGADDDAEAALVAAIANVVAIAIGILRMLARLNC